MSVFVAAGHHARLATRNRDNPKIGWHGVLRTRLLTSEQHSAAIWRHLGLAGHDDVFKVRWGDSGGACSHWAWFLSV